MTHSRNFIENLKARQRGAVVIIVAVCLFFLIGLLALVLDLGQLYIAKTELQNAADASALAGAKELNGTLAGIQNAKSAACTVAQMNKYDFSSISVADKAIDCTNLKILFGSCPNNGSCVMESVTTEEQASSKYFILVDTRLSDVDTSHSIDTWFASIWGVIKMQTFGVAVAGQEIVNVAPMGICAIDHNTPGNGSDSYYGFDRGISYNLAKVNELLEGESKGAPLWLHPTAKNYEECKKDVNFSSASSFTEYLCLGKSAAGISQNVYANTGWEATQEGALNSRLRSQTDPNHLYNGVSAELCAPDINVFEFKAHPVDPVGTACNANYCNAMPETVCTSDILCKWAGSSQNGSCGLKNNLPAECSSTPIVNWLNYVPIQQSASLQQPSNGVINDTPGSSVIASYIKPLDSSKLNPSVMPSPPFVGAAPYPTSSPYQTGIDNSGGNQPTYYTQPYIAAGVTPTAGRRLINLTIVDCSTGEKLNGICEELKKLGTGQFFMPIKADLNSTNKSIYVEFVKDVSASVKPVIKLFQ